MKSKKDGAVCKCGHYKYNHDRAGCSVGRGDSVPCECLRFREITFDRKILIPNSCKRRGGTQ